MRKTDVFARLAISAVVFIAIFTCFALPLLGSTNPTRQVAAHYGKLPLSFERNQGQTDQRVQFLARGAGFTILLGSTSATFALWHSATESTVVRMDLVGANPHITIEAQDKLPGITNYLMGSTRTKWPRHVPT